MRNLLLAALKLVLFGPDHRSCATLAAAELIHVAPFPIHRRKSEQTSRLSSLNEAPRRRLGAFHMQPAVGRFASSLPAKGPLARTCDDTFGYAISLMPHAQLP